MTDLRSSAIDFAHIERERFLKELMDWLRIPSISTDPEHQSDMVKTAEQLADKLRLIGCKNVQVFPTQRHPVVYGDILEAGADAPIVLVYGHYDVQPPEPLAEWTSGAFEPSIRNEWLYARGASDMKGQVLASVFAVEAIHRFGKLPVNIKFMIEGEEEIGSPSLAEFMRSHKELLSCDVALNPDAGMIAPEIPTIIYSLRGLAYFELRVYGPEHDLHSGLFGGVVHNPAIVLADLIAGMHDSEGKITLPGFYDSVRELSHQERIELARLPLDDQYYLDRTGAPALWGEAGYTSNERVGARPTLDVNGLYSGFTGKGSKTVIPSWAMAKISMRLVPDQDHNDVHKQLLKYLEQNAPKTVRWELLPFSGGPACMSDINTAATRALYDAMKTVWGKDPVYKREGGSVPVVADMQEILGIESVLTGFGLPDDCIHAPNEHLQLPVWYNGIDTLIHFFINYGSKD